MECKLCTLPFAVVLLRSRGQVTALSPLECRSELLRLLYFAQKIGETVAFIDIKTEMIENDEGN